MAVKVAVGVGVPVCVGVPVGVGVSLGTGVSVRVGVMVGVRVGVKVGNLVGMSWEGVLVIKTVGVDVEVLTNELVAVGCNLRLTDTKA